MKRNKFIFYKDWWEALSKMPAEMSRAIIEAIMEYALYGNEPSDPTISYSIFSLVKSQIDRDMEKYDQMTARNRENGRKGGRPKKNPENPVGYLGTQKTQPNPENPSEPKKANNIDIDINIDKDKDKNKPTASTLKKEKEKKDEEVEEVEAEEVEGSGGEILKPPVPPTATAPPQNPQVSGITREEGLNVLRTHYEWREAVVKEFKLDTMIELDSLIEEFNTHLKSSMVDSFKSTRGACNFFRIWLKEKFKSDGTNRKNDYQLARERGDREFAKFLEKRLRNIVS